MDSHLKKYAESCISCARNKPRTHPAVSLRRYPVPERPWETVSIDLIGPLPVTTNKNKYILVSVDYLTRYTATAALSGKTAKEVADAIVKIFCEHGIPRILLSDNGLEFRNSVMKSLSEKLGFRHKTIACHHPSSQGLVERKKTVDHDCPETAIQ